MEKVVEYDPFFYHKRNIIKLLGLSNIPKFIATLGMLAYDIITSATNEYC
jgi:hypothetical protein